MSQLEETCPSGWRTITSPIRLCGRSDSVSSCASVKFPSNGMSYDRVCGRVIGYRYASPDGFSRYFPDDAIDDEYVDGVSITYGNQTREHIWTLTSGFVNQCPCRVPSMPSQAPTFVGQVRVLHVRQMVARVWL